MKRIVELFGERDVQKEFHTRKGSGQRALSVTSMPKGKLQHNNKWAEDVLASFAFSAPIVSETDVVESQGVSPTPDTTSLSGISSASTNRHAQMDSLPGSRMDGQLQDMVSEELTQDRKC